MNSPSVTSLSALKPLDLRGGLRTPPTPSAEDLAVQEKFQEFVAGTFYKQMMKALRSTQQEPAYFHGGQAEDIFQSQLDEHVTDQLAKEHGSDFAAPLFSAYQHQF